MPLHRNWTDKDYVPPGGSSKSGRIKSSPKESDSIFVSSPDDWFPPPVEAQSEGKRGWKNRELSEDEIEEKAREIILNQLTAGPRSRKQLYDKLISKEIPEETAVAILDRYEELGLINDTEFALLWVGARHRSRGLGRMSIRQELRQKGIPDEDIVDALETLSTDDEYTRAEELVRKKAYSTAGLPHQKRVQRLASMLARKGYSSEISFRAVKTVLAEEDVELEPDESA